MPDPRDTPAMRQYRAFKQRHPECVLFFRMGDFYEMFDEDAVLAHKVLGITLTQRTEGVPMAGVPYHSVESYLRRMIDAGLRVAVCDQVQDPREAKGVIERAVTRVLTPGTLVDESLLESGTPNHLASAAFLDAGDSPDGRVALAIVELSTGDFVVTDCRARELADELQRRNVRELLYADTANREPPPRLKAALGSLSIAATPRPGWQFRFEESRQALLDQYGVVTLAGFGLRDDDPAIPAAGALIRYLTETQAIGDDPGVTSEGISSGSVAVTAFMLRRRTLAHIRPPRREELARYLVIDAASLRALEVERTIRAATAVACRGDARSNGRSPVAPAQEGSLLGIFAPAGPAFRGCLTSMGKRLLREWLCRPLADRAAIVARQSAVATLVEDRRTAEALAAAIDHVQDVARIGGRVALARATPRDLVALGRSLARVHALSQALESAPAFASHRAVLEDVGETLLPLAERIIAQCVDDPPAHLREGGLIRDGVDATLDESRILQRDSHSWLAEYQQRLAAQHDLPSLKVGYNRVFGYYIELPSAQARRAPADFSRRQTLKNAERYITPELKEFEDKVLSAADRAVQREMELFAELCSAAAEHLAAIGRFADTVAELDVLQCFAAKASRHNWIRPEIVDEPALRIVQGRHPVLDEILAENFVPNDVELGAATEPHEDVMGASLALITGPNMAGKSTFIRQVALIVLLAHTGSFVPAQSAVIGLTDRIFTRIGADDALHQGQSTFMVEMVETANILHNATPRSLIILDEIGRGTSTLDGLSLAWAIAERLAAAEQSSSRSPRTLFATHYHELTELADRPEFRGRIRNLHVAVREWGDEIIFLHRILPGRASRSYGIHVAKLAGLPRDVVDRADELLERLSVAHGEAPEGHAPDPVEAAASGEPAREAEVKPRSGSPRSHLRSMPATPASSARSAQMALFTEYLDHPAIEELRKLDLTRMTPMDAFDALRRLKGSVERGMR